MRAYHYLFSFIEVIFSWWSITMFTSAAQQHTTKRIKQWRKGSIAMAHQQSSAHVIKLTWNMYTHFYMDRFAVYITNRFTVHKTNHYKNSIGIILCITKRTLPDTRIIQYIYTYQHILSYSVHNIRLSFHSHFLEHGKY
jgi:hypothetical protein